VSFTEPFALDIAELAVEEALLAVLTAFDALVAAVFAVLKAFDAFVFAVVTSFCRVLNPLT